MAPHPERRPSQPEVRAFYSVAELARIGGVPTYRLLRLLRCNGVTFMRMGRAFYVTLVEIRQRLPPLWESLRAAEELRRQSVPRTPGSLRTRLP